jgi:transcriptional regulator with XRE-family HTH domain
MDIDNIGKRVLSIRKNKHLTRPQFAKLTNLGQHYIAAVEVGRRNPSFNFIVSLLDATKVNVDWLFTGKGSMYPQIKEKKEEIKGINEDRAAYGGYKSPSLDIGLDSLKSYWNKLSDEQKKVLMGAIKEMVKNNKENRKLKDFIIEMMTNQPGEIPSNVVQGLTD